MTRLIGRMTASLRYTVTFSVVWLGFFSLSYNPRFWASNPVVQSRQRAYAFNSNARWLSIFLGWESEISRSDRPYDDHPFEGQVEPAASHGYDIEGLKD